jgi:hypothetical protein
MKNVIKLSLLGALIIGGSAFVNAKQRRAERYWMCTPGQAGYCMPDLFNPGNYDCEIPPQPITTGDCGGIVQVIIPD